MKVVLLAGGFGTRISEESQFKPKPMVEIGGRPILWHIMKEYSYYGFNEFIVCAGYKQHVIMIAGLSLRKKICRFNPGWRRKMFARHIIKIESMQVCM